MAKKPKEPLQVPFDSYGRMDGYDIAYTIPNSEFRDTLRFRNIGVGNGSFSATFEDSMNRSVHMFGSEFTPIIPLMDHGVLNGTFTYIKRGASYSILRIGD